MCAVLGVAAAAKYDATIERVGRGVRPLSTDPADMRILFRRAFRVADRRRGYAPEKPDAPGSHRQRVAGSRPSASRRSTTRSAPACFPVFQATRMAPKVAGKDDGFRRREFLTLAQTLDLSRTAAEQAIADITAKLLSAAEVGLEPPEPAKLGHRPKRRSRR